MNCKNLKLKSKNYKKYIYCSYFDKEISFNDCRECPYKIYRDYKPIKKRSYSLSKKEKERFSIIAHNTDSCVICGKKRTNLHEIFYGTGKRQLSMKYGLVIPLCYQCHLRIHRDSILQTIWHIKGQTTFEEEYPDLDFLEIFGINYK